LSGRFSKLAANVMAYASSLRARVLAVLLAVALASSLVGVFFSRDWTGWLLNFGVEMAGAVATYALLDIFFGRRERREARKADLIARLGSRVPDVAAAATEELRRQGWLGDGSLKGAFLWGANLESVRLGSADLRWADLRGANLQGAILEDANLQGAILEDADLQGADLWGADLRWALLGDANLQGARLGSASLQKVVLRDASLQGANLVLAKLHGAHLVGANLHGTDLWSADLQGAILEDATFDERTTLPDSTQWALSTDMTRFTHPEHPDFWRPGEESEEGVPVKVESVDRDAIAYWVYLSRTAKKEAKIHCAHCPYCKDGQGLRPGAGGKGEWQGPFATFQEALDAAQASGRNVGRCKHCDPQP